VLLTGNTGGIGKHIDSKLSDSGINIVAVNSQVCDLSDVNSLNLFLKADMNFDGLIHCAAINPVRSFADITKEEFDKAFNVNTFSFIRMCQKINFSKGSNVIAIGSLWATGTKEGRCQYSMTKHSLLAAVKTMALEMSHNDIKVNMISPGFVDTEMTRSNNTAEAINKIEKFIPLGLTNPLEIAKMCEYLLKNNEAITGQNIIIDSGYSIKNI